MISDADRHEGRINVSREMDNAATVGIKCVTHGSGFRTQNSSHQAALSRALQRCTGLLLEIIEAFCSFVVFGC